MITPSRPNSRLVSTDDLTPADIDLIMKQAQNYKNQRAEGKPPEPVLQGKSVIGLFFEDSTRTRLSFEMATGQLGAQFLHWSEKGSSASKGESFGDTVQTINAMRPELMIVRHHEFGAAKYVAGQVDCPVINAGDGWNEHPTQALLDTFTLIEHFGDLSGKTIAICGDIAHSRVAGSNIRLLPKLGMNIRVIAPPSLMPEKFPVPSVETFDNLEDGLKDVDAVMMLRNQKERMQAGLIESDEAFFHSYGLTKEKLSLARPEAVVLHPGPMNRNVEIADDVADDRARSLILKQVENGVAVRMAVLEHLLKNE